MPLDHTAAESTPYRTTENRIQLSVRTKLAQGMLTQGHPTLQGFAVVWLHAAVVLAAVHVPISRAPSAVTDHEPEAMYVYPTDRPLPFGWRWRYSGVGWCTSPTARATPVAQLEPRVPDDRHGAGQPLERPGRHLEAPA
jgi:phospholipase A1